MSRYHRMKYRVNSILQIVVTTVFITLLKDGYGYATEPVILNPNQEGISATLEMTEIPCPVPIALIISGSGPTDRDGNTAFVGQNDCLKMVAEGLVRHGIASVRYDKRGVGASILACPREVDLRFDAYIDDAEAWGRLLLKDRRFKRLFVIGHSEGALVGALACQRLNAEGFISIAGAGRPACELINAQLKRSLPQDLLKQAKAITTQLKNGTTIDNVPPPLMALFRPSVQPYLISWFRYDPLYELSLLKMPILIIQGTTDIQVSTADARRLAKSNQHARLILVDGMNHILKMVPNSPQPQMRSYSDPRLPVSQELIREIACFMKEPNRRE